MPLKNRAWHGVMKTPRPFIFVSITRPVCNRKRATCCLLRRHLILNVDVSPVHYNIRLIITSLMRKYRCTGHAAICEAKLVKVNLSSWSMIHSESADAFRNDAPAKHKLRVIEWLSVCSMGNLIELCREDPYFNFTYDGWQLRRFANSFKFS